MARYPVKIPKNCPECNKPKYDCSERVFECGSFIQSETGNFLQSKYCEVLAENRKLKKEIERLKNGNNC